jgi:hypothetical protein
MSALARVSAYVVSKTLASWFFRASYLCDVGLSLPCQKCRRAEAIEFDQFLMFGTKETVHLSQGQSSAGANSSTLSMRRKRRLECGWLNGSPPIRTGCAVPSDWQAQSVLQQSRRADDRPRTGGWSLPVYEQVVGPPQSLLTPSSFSRVHQDDLAWG